MESICEDPDIVAANIKVCFYITKSFQEGIISTYWLSGRAGQENIWLEVRTCILTKPMIFLFGLTSLSLWISNLLCICEECWISPSVLSLCLLLCLIMQLVKDCEFNTLVFWLPLSVVFYSCVPHTVRYTRIEVFNQA